MNLSEFGLLVKSLRESSMDPYGNRWTRESLSRAIHLSPNQLGRLERGDRKYLDNHILQLLADCFNLTALERKEFLSAAVGLADEELFNKEEPVLQLQKLMNTIENLQIPAFIIDVYTDIIASNHAMMNLFLITPEVFDYRKTLPAGDNLLNIIYSSEFGCREIFGPGWRDVANIEILLFRRSTLRYRNTAYFQYLFKELLKEKQFDIDWYSSHRDLKHYDLTYELFDYCHPRYGQLKYIATETIINTRKGDLYSILYNPIDHATKEIFTGLISPEGNKVIPVGDWPEKKMHRRVR
ncbi:MAG: hypothetical protein SCJ97_00920 [Bacillota bacterium]|nr:hypothetical protein [Bacillota bacterium]